MEAKEIIITFLTICCVSVSCLFSGPRDWWESVKRNPFVALLIFLSVAAVFLGTPRGAKMLVGDPVDSVRTLRIIVLTVMGAAAIFGNLFNSNRSHSSGSLGWMVLYALLAMFSAVYSKIPLLSLYKGFEVAAFVVLGLYIGTILHTWRDIEDIVNIMLFAMWYLVVSALIGAIVWPSEAWPTMLMQDSMAFALNGVFPSILSSTLAPMAGILASCCLCWLFHPTKTAGKMGLRVVFLAALVCMVFAHSRTAILAFVLAAFFIFMCFRRTGLAIITISLGLIGYLTGNLVSYMMRGNPAGVFTSLSGRTLFWPLVIEKVVQSPLFGHGFYASQRFMFGSGAISSVDNTYLEVLLGLGVIGVMVLILAVLGVGRNLWRSRPTFSGKEITDPYFIWTELAVIFLFLLMKSFTGPSFQVLHVYLTFFVLVTVCGAAACRLKRTAPAEMEAAETAAMSAPA